MTRAETIVALLERYDDLHDPRASGNGGDQGLGGLMPHERTCALISKTSSINRCTCAYQAVTELERLLRTMRDDRHRPLLKLDNGTKVSVRACWWHLNARYISSTTVIREHQVPMLDKHGRYRHRKNGQVVTTAEYRVETLANGSKTLLVDRGVQWLEANWSRDVECRLPSDFMVAA